MSGKLSHIVLIGNYKPDKQQSMLRFLLMVEKLLNERGFTTETLYPTVFFGAIIKPESGSLGKWLSYFDKWILFPCVLLIKRLRPLYRKDTTRFHICDHSNAVYISYLPVERTIVSCHDVLAIRGAFGFKDAYCEASRTGLILQKWILNSLKKCRKIAFVSSTTKQQFLDLIKEENHVGKHYELIYNGLNNSFYKMKENELRQAIADFPEIPQNPFLLHIGSALPRKNRKMLLEMLNLLRNESDLTVCFAGEAADDELTQLISKYNLGSRVKFIVEPEQRLLLALINKASVFVFPSFSEGFGWPVIEAQACGTPVITSSIQPMPEIAGNAAMIADPYNANDFSSAFLSLQMNDLRENMIQSGYMNIKRFDNKIMIEKYIGLYNA